MPKETDVQSGDIVLMEPWVGVLLATTLACCYPILLQCELPKQQGYWPFPLPMFFLFSVSRVVELVHVVRGE